MSRHNQQIQIPWGGKPQPIKLTPYYNPDQPLKPDHHFRAHRRVIEFIYGKVSGRWWRKYLQFHRRQDTLAHLPTEILMKEREQ